MGLDYFYGREAEQFTFYRIPKSLFTVDRFKTLSDSAKLLYGLLLDRMGLSKMNGWLDEEQRVYIIFTVEEVMESLGCAEQKAVKLFKELEERGGLIERRRQGLGKPNIIYVKNFISEPEKSQFKTCENHNSGGMKITTQELRKSQGNDIDQNQTEYNEIDSIRFRKGSEERLKYRVYFEEVLHLDELKAQHPYGETRLEEILELMVDVMASNAKTIRVGGDQKPIEIVKSALMKLNDDHIRMVMRGMSENTTGIRNIRQYLLAALYNAPMTMNHYYSSLAQHHIARGG